MQTPADDCMRLMFLIHFYSLCSNRRCIPMLRAMNYALIVRVPLEGEW